MTTSSENKGALPLCYAHDYVVAKYPQLGPVLDLAFEFERGLS